MTERPPLRVHPLRDLTLTTRYVLIGTLIGRFTKHPFIMVTDGFVGCKLPAMGSPFGPLYDRTDESGTFRRFNFFDAAFALVAACSALEKYAGCFCCFRSDNDCSSTTKCLEPGGGCGPSGLRADDDDDDGKGERRYPPETARRVLSNGTQWPSTSRDRSLSDNGFRGGTFGGRTAVGTTGVSCSTYVKTEPTSGQFPSTGSPAAGFDDRNGC